jgi:hypothetical protein
VRVGPDSLADRIRGGPAAWNALRLAWILSPYRATGVRVAVMAELA